MKRFALLTNVISPHQLPLAKEIATLVGEDNIRYIYTQSKDDDHKNLAWNFDVPLWCIHISSTEAADWLENAQILLSGLREFDLFDRRAAKGLKNYYMSERWLKPPIGMLRLLHPRYFGYARRLCNMMSDGKLNGLPIGVHAARDMARLCGLMHGDFKCIFLTPELNFEKKPGGNIELKNSHRNIQDALKFCLAKMNMWGYFVEPSRYDSYQVQQTQDDDPKDIKVLWVGRLLKLKHVGTIVRAVSEHANLKRLNPSLPNIMLDIYGNGPEEDRLKNMARGYEDLIKFYPPVPLSEVRKLMREHDVYVLASDGYEGWGAVVSEALEEKMKVLGSWEAGSSATILSEKCLFHADDWQGLLKQLHDDIPKIGIGEWTAKNAAKLLVSL